MVENEKKNSKLGPFVVMICKTILSWDLNLAYGHRNVLVVSNFA